MTDHHDGDLDEELARRLGRRHPVAAIAMVDSGSIRTAVIGAETAADFEIGSISKGITGLLYADAIERGEVTARTMLGDLLPIRDGELARVTLAALSTHSSGLPRLPSSAHPLRRTIRLWRHGSNPYGESLDELLAQTGAVTLSSPHPRYSNFGFELLGHAIASAAAMPYRRLVSRRIANPLGLTTFYAPATRGELRDTAITGTGRRGRPMEAWTGEAIAPAGGIRASIHDMATLARALIDRTAPGLAAIAASHDFAPGVRIGAGWLTIESHGRQVTWHNGGTGGFRSWMGLDREAGTAVVLLTATAASVDRHGFALLRVPPGEHAESIEREPPG